MQRRDSIGTTTKILRLRTGTTRKFKTRRSQSTVCRFSDVFADEATTKSQAGLSVSGMKLRSEKNLDGNQGKTGETGRNDKSRKALSNSPTRPMSDGITVGASSTFNKLMMSMGTQKGGASSGTRLQPQLTSSSLGLTPASGAAGDISDMFAGVMRGLEELRREMAKRIDGVEERAHQGQEKLRDCSTLPCHELGVITTLLR